MMRIALLLASVAAPLAVMGCGTGWVVKGGRPARCYRGFKGPASHGEAKTKCKQLGARLAYVNDEETMNFITDKYNDRGYSLVEGRAWVGGFCEENCGQKTSWTWGEGGRAFGDFEARTWRDSYPFASRNCMQLDIDDGLFDNYYACHFIHPFICEKSTSEPTNEPTSEPTAAPTLPTLKKCKTNKGCRRLAKDPCDSYVCEENRCVKEPAVECVQPVCKDNKKPTKIDGQCCAFHCPEDDKCNKVGSTKKLCKKVKIEGVKCGWDRVNKACSTVDAYTCYARGGSTKNFCKALKGCKFDKKNECFFH